MKKKAKPEGSKKLNPLDSGQWTSESTLLQEALAPNPSKSKSRSQSPSASPPTKPPSLHIYRGGVDVTGKTTKAFSGETVTLTAVVKPKRYGGTDWDWIVGGDLVKDFKVNVIGGKAIQGHRIPYVADDFKHKSVTLHWVDGGKQDVVVSALVNGNVLSASTTVDVTRPTIDLATTLNNPQIIDLGSGVYMAQAVINFATSHLSNPGSLEWVQVGGFNRTITRLDGQVLPADGSGLDGGTYPNDDKPATEDDPSFGFFADRYDTVDYSVDVTMYLLWKSPNPGLFVPLRSVHWWFNGTLEFTGFFTAPIWKNVPPPRINPNFAHDSVADTLSYPDWDDWFDPN